MCGIIGFFSKEKEKLSSLTNASLKKIAHRGPDGSGLYSDSHVQFGHTRLSIIDLTDAGKQPMLSMDSNLVITFNGEIYNHIELRAELEALGESFQTHSDTEVLLSAYKIWGTDCIHRFRGMFAFAIWDKEGKTLFLARDRCGEKPFFYYQDEKNFIFASELKALIPLLEKQTELDPSVIDMYLHYQYVPEPYTLLKGVNKLPAAHFILTNISEWNFEAKKYWDIEDTKELCNPPKNKNALYGSILEHLEESIKLTLRSDVPVGIPLSGGIDSGAIAALAQKNYSTPMHAFCVGYPGRPPYDERNQARALAESLGMIVHEIELPVDSFVSFFPELVRIMDEPIADPAAFGHYSIPRAAADVGIKVLLSGIGGDELFWGYDWTAKAAIINEMKKKHPTFSAMSKWMKLDSVKSFLMRVSQSEKCSNSIRTYAKLLFALSKDNTPKEQLYFMAESAEFRETFLFTSKIYGPSMMALTDSNVFKPTAIGPRAYEQIPAAIIRMLFDTWLVSNCLSLSDRVSMSVGVETRLPFLDVQFIEHVMSLRKIQPDHALGQKFWLRSALKNVLPDDVLKRPKAGFTPPVWKWLLGVVQTYGDVLKNGQLVGQGIINPAQINLILNQAGSRDWFFLFFVYKLVLLEMWYKKVVD
jgi:asparagine synthase (glutamine-hydrolysing)